MRIATSLHLQRRVLWQAALGGGLKMERPFTATQQARRKIMPALDVPMPMMPSASLGWSPDATNGRTDVRSMPTISSGPGPGSCKLSVSVCICARNRPHELRRALDSISESSIAPAQIIVSDDSDDGRVEALVAGHELSIAYTRGPRTGLGANRNNAITVATGDYLLFLDDDATLGRDFFREMEHRMSGMTDVYRARAIFTGIEVKFGVTVVPNGQGILGFQSRPYEPGESLRTVVINAALFPRQLFDKVRFDSCLSYGYDEVDLTTQAVALGFTIVPCFDAINCHYPSSVGREEYRPFTDASRLYVTLKRRRWTEGSQLRAWSGFGLAIIHLYIASIKRAGLSGCREARRTVAQAWVYYSRFVESSQIAGRSELT
jgi:GT2 family glycosyltransferase